MQAHLRKCFDAIAKLEFGTKVVVETDEATGRKIKETVLLTTDILAMISPEGERVGLGKGLKARGNVEDWLGKVEESMFVSLRKLAKAAVQHYMKVTREAWVQCHCNQIVLTISQVMWARDVHEILDGSDDKVKLMTEFVKKSIQVCN